MKKYCLLVSVIVVLFIGSTAQGTDLGTATLEPTIILQQRNEMEDLGEIHFDHYPVRWDSASLDSFIRATCETYHIPGVATWTSKQGQTIWQQCFGYASLEDSIPVADTTVFMLASISKTFTATAIMQLWERGVFGLDDDINDYLPFTVRNPNYPDSTITFRMLMTHTSSIRDNWVVLYSIYVWGGDSHIPLGSYLEDYLVPGGAYYDSAYNFYNYPPGHEYYYCNEATALLGYLVEVMEDSFPIHCQDSIFYPLSLHETSWFLAGLDTNNIAIPYSWDGSNYVPYEHYGYPDYPCGQLRTSMPQLARYLTAIEQFGVIDSVRILDSTTAALMRTPQYQVSSFFEIGLIWWYWYTGTTWLWCHQGGDFGVSTVAGFSPAESCAVIVLTNGESWDGTRAIMNVLLDYAYTYEIEENETASVTRDNLGPTIFSGPLRLPEGKTCRVFDITGRVVAPNEIAPGIYFIEVEGKITQKVVKIR